MRQDRGLQLLLQLWLAVVLVSAPLIGACSLESGEDVEVVPFTDKDFDWDTVPEWHVVIDETLVRISFSYYGTVEERERYRDKDIVGVAAGEMITITLADRSTGLPRFVSASRTVAPGYSGSYIPARMGNMTSGTVYVESWDMNGLCRGRVVGNAGQTRLDVPFSARVPSYK